MWFSARRKDMSMSEYENNGIGFAYILIEVDFLSQQTGVLSGAAVHQAA